MTIPRPPDSSSSQFKSVGRCLRALQTPVHYIGGIGPKRAADLANIGITTVEELLFHLPFRYEDRRSVKPIGDAVPGSRQTFVGRLGHLKRGFNPRRRALNLTATLADDSGSIALFWFRAPGYLMERLRPGSRLLVHGKVESDLRGGKRIVHPEFELLEADENGAPEPILPIYVRPGGLPLSLMRKWIAIALAEYGSYVPDVLPQRLRERRKLMPLTAALAALHRPSASADTLALNAYRSIAHRSVIFEELFFLQLGLSLRKVARRAAVRGPSTAPGSGLREAMRALLPFELTRAQERVLQEIYNDMDSARPMQRLVQGDVGAGKTMVAWFASLRVIETGCQAIWMTPTELLAEQHFRNIAGYADRLGIKAALLTGSQSAGFRKNVLTGMARGEVQFLVGTHAVIQDAVRAPRLALGVIDEQHRFGVAQRLALQHVLAQQAHGVGEEREPHILIMSATPIPRSLAMVLYGDLDISVLDELPPGRKLTRTKIYFPQDRRAIYESVLQELRLGHQAFIVYPLVEASEELAHVRDATQMAKKMRDGVFKQFGVGLVHGKMAGEERDAVMRLFRDGTIAVLVATTVIEVGIDIPRATVMVIEHAERFGLSQLHQLRGRVGRGDAPGSCLLINRAPQNPLAAERLAVMEKEHDGFKIAEADLRLRGAGEFMGTRQSGVGEFRFANLIRDAAILNEAREEAKRWLERDAELSSPDSARVRDVLMHRWAQRLHLGTVG